MYKQANLVILIFLNFIEIKSNQGQLDSQLLHYKNNAYYIFSYFLFFILIKTGTWQKFITEIERTFKSIEIIIKTIKLIKTI